MANSDLSVIDEAEDIIRKQQDYINSLKEDACECAIVVDIVKVGGKDKVYLVCGSKLFVSNYPHKFDVYPGDNVLLISKTNQIIEKIDIKNIGNISFVLDVRKDGMVIVDQAGDQKVVFPGMTSPTKGNRVRLDNSYTVIVEDLGKEDKTYTYASPTNISWDDIGGLHDEKTFIQEAVEYPFIHKSLYESYGQKPPKGILLYGPPGCGKTMLAKAAATALGDLHGYENSGYMYVKGPEILDKYVGESEKIIRGLFTHAREFKKNHGFPALLFIDEADAILGRRGSGISADMEKTIVPTFLTEMDGLEDAGAIIMLATNRPDTLDPAIVRDRRIDKKIFISRPSKEAVKEIFMLNLKNICVDKKTSCDELAEIGADLFFSTDFVLLDVLDDENNIHKMFLQHICNGGMIEGCVHQAVSIALKRDIKNNLAKASGIKIEDILDSIKIIYKQNIDLNHHDAIIEFSEKNNFIANNYRKVIL